MKSKNIVEYDIVRVIAMLLVVFGHSNIFTMSTVEFSMGYYGALSKAQDLIINMIYKFHMPLFFALSGAVYAYCKKNGKYRTLYSLIKNKTKKLLIPYWVIGFFLLVPLRLLLGCYDTSTVIVSAIKDILFAKDSGHLWFLITLFAVFIVFFFIEKVTDKKWLQYVCVFASWCVALKIPDQYDTVIRYLFWFAFGDFFELMREEYNQKTAKKNGIFFVVGGTVFVLLFFAQIDSVIVSFLVSNLESFLGIFTTYSLARHISINMKKLREIRVFRVLDKYSFPIYLYHDILNYLLLYILQNLGLLTNTEGMGMYFMLLFLRTIGVIFGSIMLDKAFNLSGRWSLVGN